MGIQGRARQGRGEGAVHGGISVLLPSPQRFEWLGVLPNFQRLQSDGPSMGTGELNSR